MNISNFNTCNSSNTKYIESLLYIFESFYPVFKVHWGGGSDNMPGAPRMVNPDLAHATGDLTYLGNVREKAIFMVFLAVQVTADLMSFKLMQSFALFRASKMTQMTSAPQLEKPENHKCEVFLLNNILYSV